MRTVPYDRPSGTVDVYEGSAKLASAPAHAAEFYLSLGLGSHTLTAKYLGDTNYLPSELTFRHVVVLDQPIALDATAGNGVINVEWVAPADTRSVLQRLVNGAWIEVARNNTGTYHVELNAVATTAYIYRVQVYDAANAFVGTSNTDIAMLTAFNDNPAAPGMTRIKAAHFSELASATNVLRAAANLPPITVANAVSGKRINAGDLIALRNGVQDARVLVGAGAYAFTNPGTTATTIRALDLQELRNALR